VKTISACFFLKKKKKEKEDQDPLERTPRDVPIYMWMHWDVGAHKNNLGRLKRVPRTECNLQSEHFASV
jgi:hypothetical protein